MKYSVDKIEKYSEELIVVFKDLCEIVGSPKVFFSTKGAKADSKSVMQFVVVLSLVLVSFEIPIMINIGVGISNIGFYFSEILMTIMLFFIYAFCFHIFAAAPRFNLSFFSTYKIVVYSSVWFVFMYPCVYLLQAVKYEAMAMSSDVVNMGYSEQFRSQLDASLLLTLTNIIGFIFPVIFCVWVYKGFCSIHQMHKLKSAFCAISGSVLMQLVLYYVQNPINHHIIVAFIK